MITFADIHNKRELEDVVQQLRLKQLPFTLETIERLRTAIQKPKLEELLKKYMEREFVIRWQQLCSQHHLLGWPNGFGQPFMVKSHKIAPKDRIKTSAQKQSRKQSNKFLTSSEWKECFALLNENNPKKAIRTIDCSYKKKGNKVQTRTSDSSQGVYLDKSNKQKFVKHNYHGDKTKPYETYEYGLSDW